MPKKNFDCTDYGDICYREKTLYCYDCAEITFQQLTYYNGNKNVKVKFCTQCGKTYNYEWEE